MSKKIDTNFSYTTTTTTTTTGDGPEWFYEGTTTVPHMWHGIYPPFPSYNSWGCPYLLPCGDCERTLMPCHKHGNWNKWEITCNTETNSLKKDK